MFFSADFLRKRNSATPGPPDKSGPKPGGERMSFNWFHNPPPIGLDIGRASIKLLQFESIASADRVAAAARFDLAPNPSNDPQLLRDSITDAIRHALAASPFNAKQAAVTLSDHYITYTTQPATTKPTHTPNLLQTAIPLDSATQPAQQLIASADASLIQNIIAAIEAAGLTPIIIEPAPTVTARALTHALRRRADLQATRRVIDLAATGTRLLILHGTQIAAYHQLEIGGNAINQAIAAHLGISPQDAADFRRTDLKPTPTNTPTESDPHPTDSVLYAASKPLDQLAESIQQTLATHHELTNEPAPDTLLATGGHAHETWLLEALQRRLNLTISEAAPLANTDISNPAVTIDRRGALAGWTLAAGLALRNPLPKFGYTHAA